MSGSPQPVKDKTKELDQMVVNISHLDQLLNLTGEIIINGTNLDIIRKQLQICQTSNEPVPRNVIEMINVSTLTSQRITESLHSLVMEVRLVKIKEAFNRLRRPVRTISKQLGKDIEFVIEGEETLIDKTIVEKICNPLEHLIRNSIDHGIEDTIARKKTNKPLQGTITLKAYQKNKNTIIEVIDDGRGIDPDKIVAKAVEKEIITPEEAKTLKISDKYELIFKPGFSTAAAKTDLSGRGVGLDVVKTAITELEGTYSIYSVIGQGTTFKLRIPELSAVNIVDGLTVKTNENFYAIPMESVIATLEFKDDSLQSVCQNETIQYQGEVIALYELDDLLEGRESTPTSTNQLVKVIIIASKKGKIALKVKELLNPQKFVLFPWDNLYSAKGLMGSTIIGGNQLGLILNTNEIIESTIDSEEVLPSDATQQDQTNLESLNIDEIIDPSNDTEKTKDTQKDVKQDNENSDLSSAETLSKNKEFYFEIKKLLSEINDYIYKLEKNPKNTDLLHSVFRYLHSIKGDLVMMGFEKKVSFIHDVETILDRIRDNEIKITDPIIDILLDTSEEITLFTERIGHGETPGDIDQLLLDRIAEYVQVDEPEQHYENITSDVLILSPAQEFAVQCRKRNQFNMFTVYLEFTPFKQSNFIMAYIILRKLSEKFEVIATLPKIKNIEKGLCPNNIKIIVATRENNNKVEQFINEILIPYFDVTDYEIVDYN